MIYYFSGTGNTRHLIKKLSRILQIEAKDIREWLPELANEVIISPTSSILGFGFPIYGWGIPIVMEKFINRLPTYNPQHSLYVFAVLTCGDDIGHTAKQLRRLLQTKGYPLHAVWSLQMPNTYIALPGFNTDETTKAQNKISLSENKIISIAQLIQCQKSGVVDVVEGIMPGLKSGLLRWVFNRWLLSAHWFRKEKRCTACRLCVKACPMNNISVPSSDSGPSWGKACTGCLACYHVCPTHNISILTSNKGKGQHRLFLIGRNGITKT